VRSDEEFQQFAHPLIHEAMAKNDVCEQQFKSGEGPRWDYDCDRSTLTFSQDGRSRVIADVLLVGTTQADRWQWSWANGNLPKEERALTEPIRHFGEKYGWTKLAIPFQDTDEYTGWEMTALAVHALGAIGSYRFPTDRGYAYLIYRDIRWVI
jgi:hypothetical protein